MSEEIKEKIKAYYLAGDIDEVLDFITNLQVQLQQKENIIKEVREYIEEHTEDVELNIYSMPPVIRSFRGNTQTLLEILDKVEE